MSNDMVVWPGQAEFLQADAGTVALFTGAGYGKSDILCRKAIKDCTEQDYWWNNPNAGNWKNNPLQMIMGAPTARYIKARLIPAFRGYLDQVESIIGRSLRQTTGRNRDGWFGGNSDQRQEMANACDFLFYPLYSAESAVATDAAGLYIDEVTMLVDPEIWIRSCMRVRDKRANKLNIACVGTPEEGHFIYEMLVDPDTKEARPGNVVLLDSSIKNPLLGLDYFTRVGQTATQWVREMQVMGRWVAGAGGQRFGHIFSEEEHVRPMDLSPMVHPGLQYHVGWDPGYRTGSVVVMYNHPRGFWCIVDEIVIQDMTTREVCKRLLDMGYNRNNICFLGMDPRDANKRRSTSRQTDEDIVLDIMGVRPKLVRATNNRGRLRVRLDVIATMLEERKLFISDRLRPRDSHQLGVVNAMKKFATARAGTDKEAFVDKPTRETTERWKHPIDAIHYVLHAAERGTYQRVNRESYFRKQIGEDYVR